MTRGDGEGGDEGAIVRASFLLDNGEVYAKERGGDVGLAGIPDVFLSEVVLYRRHQGQRYERGHAATATRKDAERKYFRWA